MIINFFHIIMFAPLMLAMVKVTTYSSHYETTSRDLESYVEWYKVHERPEASDAEFHAAEDFELVLDDFRERFGQPASGE